MEKAIIRINSSTRERISLDNYKGIEGLSEEELILLALLVNLSAKELVTDASTFLKLYIWMADTLHIGFNIDLEFLPQLKDSNLLADILSFKGKDVSSLKDRKACLRIANLITNGDKEFVSELDDAFTYYEERLLLSMFFPH